MSFGVYRYDHNEFGPIMLLLDSQLEQKKQIEQQQGKFKKNKQNKPVPQQSKQKLQESASIQKRRGSSFNKSPVTVNKTFERYSFGQKSLGKKHQQNQRSVQLPMIPKGKKKKVDI